MQKSIEVEYWVIDQNGALTEPGALVDHSDLVEPEFADCLFELKTPPCETIAGLRRTFTEQLDDLLSRAASLGKGLVPLGTPLHSESIEMRDSERGTLQRTVLGSDFEYAKHCAGTHVHFEKRNVVDQLNTLIALDPVLALCNSSPYYQGNYLASSARAFLYRKRCYADFPKHGQLWDYTDTVAQWQRRLERRYEEFEASALENGHEEASVDAHFSPDDVVWTPIRLRDEMPTVEWRSPDATLPSQILQLVDDLETILEHIHHTNVTVAGTTGGITDDGVTLPPFETVCEYAETAIHEGVESTALTEYCRRMGFDVDDYAPLSSEFDQQECMSLEEARTKRLQYADRLSEDVDRLVAPL